MDLPGQFPGYGSGYDNGFPGAPPMGGFPNYQYPPFMPHSSATPLSTNDPNNAPPFAQNVQTIPSAGHPYYQAYGMDPRQPFSMPGYIPASPHSSTIPTVPYHVPIQNLNPHQRVALAEQFAKSSKAPGAAVPPNVAGSSPALEHLTPRFRPQGISSDGLATTSTPSDIPPNQPAPSVQKPVRRESNSLDYPYRSRGVRKLAGHLSSKWLENVQQITKYKFRDPDILEEALESPGSGIRFVGNTHRDISEGGNKRLATVGARIMESVLTNDCYNAGVPKRQIIGRVANAITNDILGEIASTTELERFIHGSRVIVVGSSNRRTQEAALVSASQAVKAVVGAVFVDGGGNNLEEVKKVMEHLGLREKCLG